MKNLIICIFSILLSFGNHAHSQIEPDKLISMSKKQYMSFEKAVVTVETRSKNMINVDTFFNFRQCYIDNIKKIKIFRIKENAFVKMGSEEYNVSYSPEFFFMNRKTKKNHSIYENEFKNFPFVEPETFFGNLRKILDNQSKVLESDSFYLLFTSTKSLVFRKYDYSIKSITESIYDPIFKGFQFKQYSFGIINMFDTSLAENVKHVLSIINNPLKKRDNIKDEVKPEFIERSLLEQKIMQLTNGKIVSIKNKVVFLDFFYQGCYPCVKSYPYVNSLFNAAGSNLVVLGVDQLPSDTLTIDRYIEKYNLQYPILVGEPAAFLTQYFKLHSFPTFIVIDQGGRVIKYGDGFTKSSFKMLTKKILH